MGFAPIKKSQAARVRPAPVQEQKPEVPVPGLAGEAAAARDERAEMLALVPQDCQSADDFVREIHSLWRQTKARFLLIGRYLIAAKERWPHGDYERNIQDRLPFGPEVARQIKAVAEAVYLRGRLREEELPSSYSIAYYLTTLDEQQLADARSKGLTREDLKRREIIEFKKTYSTPKASHPVTAGGPGDDVKGLLAEKGRLLARLAEINQALEKAGIIDVEPVQA